MVPALDAFQPELVLVSSGFDASFMDNLASMILSSEDFRCEGVGRIPAELEGVKSQGGCMWAVHVTWYQPCSSAVETPAEGTPERPRGGHVLCCWRASYDCRVLVLGPLSCRSGHQCFFQQQDAGFHSVYDDALPPVCPHLCCLPGGWLGNWLQPLRGIVKAGC